jgi:protein O-mannosyl-transferase
MARIATPSSGKKNFALALGLLIAVLLAYRPAWNGQPVWDDDAHMTKLELRSAAGLVRIWTHVGATQQYYPLVHSVFWVEHRLFGDSTPGYHLVNILLHLSSALLLVAILRRLGIPGAWLAGGIFALHPVMVESVAWITELKNTLSGVFFLGAGLAYLEFDRKRERRLYAIAFALFLTGVFAKSVIVTLPGALLVVFWWMRGKIGWKRDVVPLLPFIAIGTVSGLFTAWVERRFIGAVGNEFSFTIMDRFLIAGRAVWFYLSKLLWPADLIFIYPRWRIDSAAWQQYLFPLALLLSAGLLWGLRKRSRAPLAVLLYFAGTLFPSLGFFNVYPFRYSFVADHFQYLASLAPIAAAAACIDQGTGLLREGVRWAARRLLCAGLLSVLFLLCWKQSGTYRDAETLYQTTISRNPDCWMAHYNLAILLAKTGRLNEAEAHYLKALAANPRHAKAHINLGSLLAKTGRTDQAIAHSQQALEINPNSAEAHYNVGILFAEMGRIDEAGAHYVKALEINPNYAEAHYNLGSLLDDMGRANEAMSHYLRALEINPGDTESHNALGVLLAKMGRADEALTHFQGALELRPDYAEAHNNLGILLARMGRTDEAVAHYQKALAINPNYAEAHNNLGVLLASIGRSHEAIAHCRRALDINPGEIGPLKNLALALVRAEQWTEAISVLQNGLTSARSAGDEPRARMISQILAKVYETINTAQAGSGARGLR